MLAALDRKLRLTLGIHDVDRCDGRESVVGRRLQMALRIGPAAAVGRVALDNRTVDLLHQRLDERRLQEVVAARLAGREFDGYLAPGLTAERLVDSDQIVGRNLLEEIDLRKRRLGCLGLRSGRSLALLLRIGAAGRGEQRRQQDRHNVRFHCFGYLKVFALLQNLSSMPPIAVTRGMGYPALIS